MSKTYTLTATALTRYTGTGRAILSDGASCSKVTAAASNYVGYQSAYKAIRAEFDHDTIAHLRTLAASAITSITLDIPITGSAKATVQTYYGTCKAVEDTKCYVDTQKNLDLTGSSDSVFSLNATSAGIPQNSYAFAFGGCRSSQSSNYYKTIGSPTLKVVTTESDFKLSYNANGGSGAPADQTATDVGSHTFTISSTEPTRSGYIFKGWATSSSASSAAYQPGGSITITANTTLYAVWHQTIKLTYNANGGSNAPAAQSQTVYSSATFTITASEPTPPTSHIFVGWNSQADGAGTDYAAGSSITITANKTLYAKYVSVASDDIHYKHDGVIYGGETWVKRNGQMYRGEVWHKCGGQMYKGG